MAEFLGTTGTTYHLEQLIRGARTHIYLVSPFLKFNDRIKEFLEDKNRMKIDIRVIYGKSELAPAEIAWLQQLDYVRTSFCQNLHAKCYLNEDMAIITSMNLYEFSQQNNNEMGVLIRREQDPELYAKTYEEVQRINRISDRVRISAQALPADPEPRSAPAPRSRERKYTGKPISSSKLAKKHGLKTPDLLDILEEEGFVELDGKDATLTPKGERCGAEEKTGRYGDYIVWPDDLDVESML